MTYLDGTMIGSQEDLKVGMETEVDSESSESTIAGYGMAKVHRMRLPSRASL